MTKTLAWRRALACAAIDILLICTAGAAMAAPGVASGAMGSTAAAPVLPAFLLAGVGLWGTGRFGFARR